MSPTTEIGLFDAKTALESMEATVEERIDRARRLVGVAARKRGDGNLAAPRGSVAAARRTLQEAKRLLDAHDPHRTRLHRHVASNPPIEGGVYHGHVRTFDELRATLDELARRMDLERALSRHRRDVERSAEDRTGPWKRPYDVVRESLHLLHHVRSHDVPALVHAGETLDRAGDLQFPTDGLRARLTLIHERVDRIAKIDHDEVARNAATVNSELAADYREMVDRFHAQRDGLEDDLAGLAALIAGTAEPDETATGDPGADWPGSWLPSR